MPPPSLAGVPSGGCFAIVVGRCWLVGWMLCHLVRVADLRSFGGVVFFSRFSCVGLARFAGSGVAVLCSHGVFLACVYVSSVFLCF